MNLEAAGHQRLASPGQLAGEQLTERLTTDPWLVAVATITVLLAYYQLPMPFNVSENPILRLFTTNRLILGAGVFVIVYLAVRGRASELRHVPAKLPLLLVGGTLLISNAGAYDPQSSLIFLGDAATMMALFAVTTICCPSAAAVRTVLRSMLYTGVLLMALSDFHVLSVDRLLPHTFTAAAYQTNLQLQTLSTGVAFAGVRGSFLWFDANSAAYIDGVLVCIAVYFASSSRYDGPWRALHFALLGFVATHQLLTYSRGGLIALAVAAIPLGFLVARSRHRSVFVALILLAALAATLVPSLTSAGAVIQERFQYLLAVVGLGPYGTTGLENGRLDTAQVAWTQFLERPILGWGGRILGVTTVTGNHIFYLGYLGNWGVIGFSAYLLFLGSIIGRAAFGARSSATAACRSEFLVMVAIALLYVVKGFFADHTYDLWICLGLIGGLLAIPGARLASSPTGPLPSMERPRLGWTSPLRVSQ